MGNCSFLYDYISTTTLLYSSIYTTNCLCHFMNAFMYDFVVAIFFRFTGLPFADKIRDSLIHLLGL